MEKVIQISGRIDNTNASELESRIANEITSSDDKIILDVKDLEYISSAGLRVILKLRKKHNDVSVINCNTEVYEVFSITGFTELMDITKAYRELSIDGCEKIGDGFYGTVYRVNPEVIVKVYKNLDSLDMIKRERELSRKAFILGIPTAIPYDIVKVGNKYGSVFELLNCMSLDKLIQNGESVEELGKACSTILKKIHSISLKEGELPYKKEQIIKMAMACSNYLSSKTVEDLVNFIDEIPETNTLMHGDFHIKNLMKQDDDILLIDMDTLSLGNPIFEFGAMHAAYIGFACINPNNPKEFLGITKEQCETMFNTIFNNYYSDKNEGEREKLLEQIKIISYLEVLYLRTRFKDNDEIHHKEINYSSCYLTENINNVKNNDNLRILKKTKMDN